MYWLYSILLYFSQCHSDITRPHIYIFLNSILLLLDLCALLWIVRYYRTVGITSDKYVYVINNNWFDLDLNRCLSVDLTALYFSLCVYSNGENARALIYTLGIMHGYKERPMQRRERENQTNTPSDIRSVVWWTCSWDEKALCQGSGRLECCGAT